MSLKPVKLLAAAVVLTCGLGLSVGTGWVTSAEAQAPGGGGGGGPGQTTADPEAEVKRLQTELDRARAVAEQYARVANKLKVRSELDLAAEKLAFPAAFSTAKWEYDLVDIAATFDKAKFGAFLQEREAKGWEFLGSTTLGKSGGVFQWLFRRPLKAATAGRTSMLTIPGSPLVAAEASPVIRYGFMLAPNVEDAAAIQAEIDRLTAKLAGLKAKSVRNEFLASALSLKPAEVAALLTKMADKKFGKGKCTVTASDKGVVVEGDKDAVEWATAEVKSLFVN